MASFHAVLLVLIMLVVGCTSDRADYFTPHPDQGGAGGSPVTAPVDDSDLFDPGILDPGILDDACCVAVKPFKRLSLFTDTDEPCPSGTVEGDTLYADFLPPPPHTCACSCSAPTCVLPDGMHTNAAKCANADGSTQLAFGPGNGWDGACSNQDPVPGGIQCGGAPCVASLTVPAVAVTPCEPSDPVASKPEPSWGRAVRECALSLSAGGCPPGQICAPAHPEGPFDLCLYGDGDMPCPPGWAHEVLYTGVNDDRDCQACTCGSPEAECDAVVTASSDAACGVLAGAVLVSTQEPACVDILSGSALGSVHAAFLDPSPGSCAEGGGAPTGSVLPDGPSTLCCRAPLAPPG